MELALFITENIVQIIVSLVGLYIIERIFRKQHYVKTRNYRGTFTNEGWDRSYKYNLGDGLISPGYLPGICVKLPKSFPQLYLDSHKDSAIYGPAEYFNLDQRIDLEGDFNSYFQLYAPKGYENLALSIMTPDVMQTFMDMAQKFDVEIKENELRLISDSSIIFNETKQNDIKCATEAILEELDHKCRSWVTENQLPTLLESSGASTIKMGKRYVISMANILLASVVAIACTVIILISRG